MDYETEDIEINEKLTELNLALPSGLTFFPENFEAAKTSDDFVFTESIIDITKVFKSKSIEINQLGGDANKLRSRKNADWYAPAIFFSLHLITENPTIVSISLNVLSNYITDFFKGSFGEKKVKLDIYVEKKGKKKIKKISYNGSIEGLKELEKIINSKD
jgi:hypothetical protein